MSETTSTPLLSASQIDTYGACARKWAWRYIAGVETPQHPAAALGTEVDDEQLQPYLRDGREFTYAGDAGYIANALRPFLPQPKAPGLEVQKHFLMSAPGGAGFAFQGYLDLWLPDSVHVPDMPGGAPFVGDFKTTSDLKWAKSEKTLTKDVQWTLYAVHAMHSTGARTIDTAWLYSQTRGTRKAKRTYLRVIGSPGDARGIEAKHIVPVTDVVNRFLEITETGREMLRVRASGAGPLDLPPNPDACEAYGGCPHRDKCNLSPGQIIDAHAARAVARTTTEDTMSTMSILDQLRAKKAAQSGVAPAAMPVIPVATPSVQVQPAPSPLPAPAPIAGVSYSAEFLALPKDAIVGINPPEKDLPAEPAVVAAPAPAKRGRPKKEAAPAAEAEPLPEPGVVDPIPWPVCDTVTVTYGIERYSPVQYQHFEVGPFMATSDVRPGETIASATARVHGELAAFADTERVRKARAFVAAASGGQR